MINQCDYLLKGAWVVAQQTQKGDRIQSLAVPIQLLT